MKCLICGSEMQSRTGSAPYKALPGTVLKGIRINECPQCGEREIEIPRIAELNRVLARVLICQPARLTGPQIRFLRKHLGLSGTDFARHVGVKKETVSRWESDKQPISPSNDRLLRMMVAFEDPIENYTSFLPDVATEEPEQAQVTIWEAENQWTPAEQARF